MVAVVTGNIRFDLQNAAAVAGTWSLYQIAPDPDVGPQVGQGILKGVLDRGVLDVDLRPGWADNNLLLHGQMDGTSFRGTWTEITIAGPPCKGHLRCPGSGRRQSPLVQIKITWSR